MVVRILVCAVLLAGAWPAHAQQSVNLQFSNGRVSLRAQNAPVRAILAEWARLGGAIIVNGDRVAGAPVTLELTDVPESQALDIVLRNVAGYMLGPRRAGTSGASAYDRIMILPTSVAPQNPPPAPQPTAAARPVLPRPIAPRVLPQQPADDTGQDDLAEADVPDAEEATGEQPGTVVTPANPFGIPPGASARPGVISPVPRPQAAEPNRVE
jgi:hypothetical protein